MTQIADIAISALLVLGGALGLIGSYGLIKLPSLMLRLHAPTKSATLGIGSILIASMLWFWLRQGNLSFHELLIVIFLFLTAPITANFIAKAHLHRNAATEPLPPPEGDTVWAGQQDPGKEEVDEPAILPEEGLGRAL